MRPLILALVVLAIGQSAHADVTGIELSPDWEGAVLSDPAYRPPGEVLMESFYAGNCLFDHRPLYFGVRSEDYLYIWREYIDPTDKINSKKRELFDLRADPGQQNDIYRPDHPVIERFDSVIARRMAEIPEIAERRIVDHFGPLGADAAERVRGLAAGGSGS